MINKTVEIINSLDLSQTDLETLIESFPFPASIKDIDTDIVLYQNATCIEGLGNKIGLTTYKIYSPEVYARYQIEDDLVRSTGLPLSQPEVWNGKNYIKRLLPLGKILLVYLIPEDQNFDLTLTASGGSCGLDIRPTSNTEAKAPDEIR